MPTTDTSHHSHDDADAAPDDHAERTTTPAEHGHEREPDGPPVHTVEVHPEWCSPVLCYRTEEGVRVHMQAPACWEQDDLTRMRFKTGLLDPEDDPFTYLELKVRSFLGGVHAILPLSDARRLRDQLNAHLDAAESGRRNRVEGVDGQLLTSSDQPVPSSNLPTAPADHRRDETPELCRRIEHRGWLTEPERAALARLVSHVVAARAVITRGDAALGDETDRALHVRGVWCNVDAALGELLDATANRVRP